MTRILKPILTLITINSLAILFFSLQSYSNPINRQLATRDSQPQSDNDLKFKDLVVAYQILTLLDVFEELKPEDPYGNVKVGVFDGLKINDHYCEEHRAYFVSNPELVFEQQNYFCDYWTWHPLRTTVFPGIGTDVYPMISTGAPRRVKLGYLYDMRPDTNIFYSNLMMFERRVIGKHYSCLSQISNHIPGNGALYKKDEVGALLAEYSKQYTSRPECLSSEKFFPKTWVMENEAQCLDFFSEFLSAKYDELKAERGIVYFRKISGVHEGQGVFPVTEQDEQFIRETYKDGRLCGQVQDKNLIQYSIYNPLLINGKKFDFRVFMLVASTNPLIAFYHDGYLRISLFDYDTNSEHKGSFITNTAISKKIFKLAEQNGTYNGMTADELKDMSYGFYDKLQSYLLEKGIIQDPNWKNNYLKPEIKKVMVHLLRLAQHKLLQRSSISQLFGVDLMMDENLNIWFIEANAIPMVKGWTEETKAYFNSMMTDHLEILFSLLRSRMKRVIHYVNSIIEAEGTWDMPNDATFNLQYLEKRREEFRKISMNSFEPEFELSLSNKFEKILDENYEGTERYSGLLKAQCL